VRLFPPTDVGCEETLKADIAGKDGLATRCGQPIVSLRCRARQHLLAGSKTHGKAKKSRGLADTPAAPYIRMNKNNQRGIP